MTPRHNVPPGGPAGSLPPSAWRLLIVAAPWAMFHWLTPFVSSATLGNDYQSFHIDQQMELMFSLWSGSFPLYMPGFRAGAPSSALTLGQLFHPLPYLASLFPGYWRGDALEILTALRLVSLSVAQLFLFGFFRKMRLGPGLAFVLSFVAVYNLRMLDLFRYGASLENYVGFLLLVSALGGYWRAPGRFRWPMLISLSTYLLVTGGHPQMMYFGLMGAGLFLFAVPLVTPAAQDEPEWRPSRYYLAAGGWMALGIVMSSAWILPYAFEFIAGNSDRVGREYAWAVNYQDSFRGMVENLFDPMLSDVHGAFGGSSLTLAAFLAPLALLAGLRPGKAVLLLWGGVMLTLLCALGAATPLHRLLWEGLPLFDSFRVPGRISLYAPFYLMVILACLARTAPATFAFRGATIQVPALTLVALAAIAAFAGYLQFAPPATAGDLGMFTPISLHALPGGFRYFAALAGLASLVGLGLAASPGGRYARAGMALLCFGVIFQTGFHLRYGTWVEPKRQRPTLDEMAAAKRHWLGFAPHEGLGLCPSALGKHTQRTFVQPELCRTYGRVELTPDMAAAYETIGLRRKSDVVVAVSRNASLAALVSPRDRADSVKLVHSSYNRLVFQVSAQSPAMLALGVPFDQGWTVRVNGVENQAVPAQGLHPGVVVPAGESVVEFRFASPWGMAGMAASGLGFAALLVIASTRLNKPRWVKALACAVGVAAPGCILSAYALSLYAGRDLGAQYAWSAGDISAATNVAFAKPVTMSSLRGGMRDWLYTPRAVTDGSKRMAMSTGTEETPFVAVDLGEATPLRALRIWWGNTTCAVRAVSVSVDGVSYALAGEETSPAVDESSIALSPEQPVRFIRLHARRCSLGVREVEALTP